MSIWITGDIHGDPTRFSMDVFPEQKEMTKDDTIIICGDFGLVWNYKGETPNERWWLDWLENKSFTTVFVDGNHESFTRLYSYPMKEWNGGLVHEIRPSVLHLMRGEIYEIDGKRIFTFGGASSHDIADGILDCNDPDLFEKIEEMDDAGKNMYRIKGISWWSEELPTTAEMDHGRENLKRHNNKIDYIITHSPSASVIALLGQGLYEQDILTKYLEEIRCNNEYKRMFSGHMHINKAVNDKDILLYDQIIRIN